MSRHVPRGAARTLARGWSSDARRWTWATTSVLALTLLVLLGTSGLLEGTTQRTFDQVSDFYTGELRVTPSRAGAVPADWFPEGSADALRQAGAEVSERVEGQFVLSRRSFADAYLNEKEGVPVHVAGSDADPEKVVTLGAIVGVQGEGPGVAAIRAHLVEGSMPRARTSETAPIEVLMSRPRADGFLTEAERGVPGTLLAVVGTFFFDVTSGRLDGDRQVLMANVKVVGLYETGVDLLDSLTLVAPAQDVRYLWGQDADLANVLVVHGGDVAAARRTAEERGWATQETEEFSSQFIGQMVGVLQLSSQQRELAVATAIGVPRRILADALSLQVFAMAGWACAVAAALTVVMAFALPFVLSDLPGPLPLGFGITWRSIAVAAAVTVVSVGVGLWVGMRSRARLPLAASLRAA